jgi:beta-galactosidase GanA
MIRHLIVLAALSAAQPSIAEDAAIPRIETRVGRPVLMVDGGPFTILGEQMNNSSNYPDALKTASPVLDRSRASTVEVHIAWQQVEPREGQFDLSFLQVLLKPEPAYLAREPIGGVAVTQLPDDEYLVVGDHVRMSFEAADGKPGGLVVRLEVSDFQNGRWVMARV